MYQQTASYHEELVGTLNAISIVATRLAKNLLALDSQQSQPPQQHCRCSQCQNLIERRKIYDSARNTT
ncbi:MAG: hypothetical protein R3Y63_04820 [Eubacteriales bacterium]